MQAEVEGEADHRSGKATVALGLYLNRNKKQVESRTGNDRTLHTV